MEISLRDRDFLLASLIVIALVIPLITIQRVHSEEIELELHYRYEYSYRSVDTSYDDSATYWISVGATRDNLSLALSGEEVLGYPVWLNVTDWSVGYEILLADTIYTVDSSQERYGFYCWRAGTNDGTHVYYHKELGIFLGSSYFDSNWLGGTVWTWTSRDIDMTYQNIDDFDLVEYVFNPDALLLSVILIEGGAIYVLADKRTIKLALLRNS